MKEIIYGIVFGVIAIVGIVWGIWYENFCGEKPAIPDQEDFITDDDTDDKSDALKPEADDES